MQLIVLFFITYYYLIRSFILLKLNKPKNLNKNLFFNVSLNIFLSVKKVYFFIESMLTIKRVGKITYNVTYFLDIQKSLFL